MLSLLPPTTLPGLAGPSGSDHSGGWPEWRSQDKPLVVPYETKKRFHLFFGSVAGPVPDGCDLALLGSDVPPSYLVPQV